ncbi:MAG: YwqG family protein [Actinomycetota bacterium]|nr:YwqG family protein [Actinomycetota bacterium]
MIGHPTLVQPPDPRDEDPDLCLLLQVDSDEAAGMMLGDVGRLYLWIHRDDLAARRFDRATLEFQAH